MTLLQFTLTNFCAMMTFLHYTHYKLQIDKDYIKKFGGLVVVPSLYILFTFLMIPFTITYYIITSLT